jgi:hypothetical protein
MNIREPHAVTGTGTQRQPPHPECHRQLEQPLNDAALEAKFFDLTAGILFRPQATRLAETCWMIEKLGDAGALARQAAA